jgi:hypothetical protein
MSSSTARNGALTLMQTNPTDPNSSFAANFAPCDLSIDPLCPRDRSITRPPKRRDRREVQMPPTSKFPDLEQCFFASAIRLAARIVRTTKVDIG